VYEGLAPGEVTKYTVVMWLEGDDPDCTDALIGGHLGLEMQFSLENSDEDQASEGFVETIIKAFKSIKENLKFWEE
jgi:hypothetical protein